MDYDAKTYLYDHNYKSKPEESNGINLMVYYKIIALAKNNI